MRDGIGRERCRGEESKQNMSNDGGSGNGNDERRRKKSRTRRIKIV